MEGPNSLWHIDGNHKLIKWRLVIHGDVVLLISMYSLPDQVKSDQGGENIEVWRFMLEHHQSESAMLVGSWRDVYRCVGVLYADLFREMVADGRSK